MLHAKNKDLVVPGMLLAEGDYIDEEGTHKEHGKVFASVVGIAYLNHRKIRVVALKGKYVPKQGDSVIGIITDERFNGWKVNINSPYEADLNQKDIQVGRYESLRVGDLVYARIVKVTEIFETSLYAKRPYGRLDKGILIEIQSARVPRLIGRKGSMIKMINEKTRSVITVGQNGLVWIRGGNQELAAQACLMVDREAHIPGLTDRVSEFLSR
ncbi:MAG: KH domain-containing protein [Theionarchaea archaeon]|nr:KH domain-containing protein [Theionarchaea archaeon]